MHGEEVLEQRGVAGEHADHPLPQAGSALHGKQKTGHQTRAAHQSACGADEIASRPIGACAKRPHPRQQSIVDGERDLARSDCRQPHGETALQEHAGTPRRIDHGLVENDSANSESALGKFRLSRFVSTEKTESGQRKGMLVRDLHSQFAQARDPQRQNPLATHFVDRHLRTASDSDAQSLLAQGDGSGRASRASSTHEHVFRAVHAVLVGARGETRPVLRPKCDASTCTVSPCLRTVDGWFGPAYCLQA